RNTLRYKIILGLLLVITVTLIYFLKGEALIKLFLGGSEDGADKIATLNYGFSYLKIMLWGLPGFMITQAFASTLREGGETILPMKAGIIAITTNLVFNWILIFGNLGFPTLGVQGAAIATVISRYVEASIVIIGAIKKKFDFMKGLLSRITVPIELAKKISTAAAPLLFNECLWSLGMTFLLKCYSSRGLNAVAGYNIANTLYNVLSVTFMAVGSSVGIIVGQLLGAGKKEEAVETARKMIAFAVIVGTIAGLILVSISPFFPKLYNTNDAAKVIATKLLITMGCCLPLNGFKHSTYFTLRSGGKILVTFIFDSGFLWTVSAPIAFLVSTFTNLGVVQIFLCIQAGDLIKCAIGTYLVKKRVWVNKIID
ncbi:MAG: MATE family efflux transporter, partial [Sphaerochaetaceae bacterium]|nr:MATE family efflux transporter [Sphaerochaetaceae bacterium]